MELDTLIYRHFTKKLLSCDEGEDAYSLFSWKNVGVDIKSLKKEKVYVMFPEDFSQNICDFIAEKYLETLAEGNSESHENLFKSHVHKLVSFWTEALYDEVLITEEQKQIMYDEIVYMILAQMFSPGEIQRINTEDFAKERFSFNEEIGDVSYSKEGFSASDCFILGPEDSLSERSAFLKQILLEEKMLKLAANIGTNWSLTASKDEIMPNGKKTPGLVNFLKISCHSAEMTAYDKLSESAIKINMINPDHPEVMDFINWKVEEENVIKNALRLNDDFMKALGDDNAGYRLFGRIDKDVVRDIGVTEIFDGVCRAILENGSFSVHFGDTIDAWHTCPAGSDNFINAPHNKINSSDAKAAFFFIDDSACSFATLNLLKFYENSFFNVDSYMHAIKLAMLVLEGSVYFGSYPSKKLALNAYRYRPVGLGISNLNGLIEAAEFSYESDEARNLGAAVLSLMTGYSYYISALMAEKIGPFDCYSRNREHMQKVIRNHARAAAAYFQNGVCNEEFEELAYRPAIIDYDILRESGFENFTEWLPKIWSNAVHAGNEFGYRNAQVTCISNSPEVSTSIDHLNHIKMIAALSPHISGGINETVFATCGASEKDVFEALALSWELGIKAITFCYNDDIDDVENNDVLYPELTRNKPNGIRNAKLHEACIDGSINLYITVSFYDEGKIGEIYISTDKQEPFVKGLLDGVCGMVSGMLQYGVSAKDISLILKGQKFEPYGRVSGHPYIKYAYSVADLIGRIIDIELGNFKE